VLGLGKVPLDLLCHGHLDIRAPAALGCGLVLVMESPPMGDGTRAEEARGGPRGHARTPAARGGVTEPGKAAAAAAHPPSASPRLQHTKGSRAPAREAPGVVKPPV
jgi:hypothetical protein